LVIFNEGIKVGGDFSKMKLDKNDLVSDTKWQRMKTTYRVTDRQM